jgi:hypothetical protein
MKKLMEKRAASLHISKSKDYRSRYSTGGCIFLSVVRNGYKSRAIVCNFVKFYTDITAGSGKF